MGRSPVEVIERCTVAKRGWISTATLNQLIAHEILTGGADGDDFLKATSASFATSIANDVT